MSFLWFGLLLYKWHNFELIDELYILTLSIYTISVYIKEGRFRLSKTVLCFMLVVFFYLLYSLCIGIASTKAIFFDCFQEIKPYVVLICAMYLSPKFSKRQSFFIRCNCFFVFVCALLNAHTYSTYLFHAHPTNIANISITLFLLYIFFYHGAKSTVVSWVMLAYGWVSGRSKFFAEFIAFIFIWKRKEKFKFKSKKFFFQTIIISAIILIIIWPKFKMYVIDGFDGNSTIARTVLYITSIKIFIDYFPFGSGFGSFGNYGSATIDYSPLYRQYDIDQVWGLTESHPVFAADTFYPILSQFGVVGVVLFFFFWRRIFLVNIRNPNMINYKIALSIFTVLFIDCFANTAILNNRGVLLLLLLGLITPKTQIEEN